MVVSGSELDAYMPIPGALRISHLLFIDDYLLVALTSIRNAVSFSRIIEEYFQASGQLVNLFKYVIIFSPKIKAYHRYIIRQRLGVVEEERGCMALFGYAHFWPEIEEGKLLVPRESHSGASWGITC